MIYLFRSYLSVSDKEFNRYIQEKKEKYEEGDPEINVHNLMSLALTKYNTLVQAKVWGAKTPEEEKLIALTAQLKAAKDQIAALHKTKQSTQSNQAAQDKSTNSSGNRNNHSRKPIIPTWLPAWHKEKKGNKLEKDGKTFYWCTFHGYYSNHDDKDCKAKKAASSANTQKDDKDKNSSGQSGKPPSALKIAKALIAVTNANNGSSSDAQDDA